MHSARAWRGDQVLANEPDITPSDLVPTIQVFGEIETEGRHFTFSPPLRARREFVQGVWSLEVPELSVVSPGTTRAAAIEALGAYIGFLWDTYATALDADLDRGGKELKRKLNAQIAVRSR